MTCYIFFFQAEDGIRDSSVTGVQTCALPISESPRRLLERVPCETFALGPHIISAQLAQRIRHKFGGDSLAPGHVEIRVVERLGDSSREGGRFGNRLQIQGGA